MVPMACSYWARATPTSMSCARTVSSWVRAWATSASVPMPPLKTALGEVELFSRSGRWMSASYLGVEAAQLEVVGGHFGVKAEVDAGHIGGAGLRVLVGLLDGAANSAPEVGLPTCLGVTENRCNRRAW